MNISNATFPVNVMDEIESKVFIGIFVLTLFLGMSGNGLVLLVVVGKGSRTVSDIFIMNLSISDLTFLILCLVIQIQFYSGALHYSTVYCKFVWPMLAVTFFASVFTLCAMALHRCHGILNPLKANLTVKQTLWLVGGLWILAIIPVLPLMIVTKLNEDKMCFESWSSTSSKIYTVALFIFQYIFPLCIIIVAYIRIIRRLSQRMVPGTFIDQQGHATICAKRRDNTQVIKVVAVIVALFAICMLPHEIAGLMIFFGDETRRRQGMILFKYSPILLYIHSCLNPMVYGVLTRQFRKDYKKYLLMLVCCCRYKKVTSSLKKRSSSKSRSTAKTTLRQKQENEERQQDKVLCGHYFSLKRHEDPQNANSDETSKV